MNPRRIATLAAAALLALPGAALAQSYKATTSTGTSGSYSSTFGGPKLSGLIGYESGTWDGLALRFDADFPVQRLAPKVMLSVVGSIGFSHLTRSVGGFDPATGFPISVDSTVNRLDFIPAARFHLQAAPSFELYGDVGLGLYYASVHVDSPFAGSADDFSLKMRFGVGGYFTVNPTLDLGGELALQPHFGDYDETTFTAMLAARFKI